MGRLNRPSKPNYEYRSPGQTNAKDATPNLREDVSASQKADTGRAARGLDTAATRPQNRKQVQEAGGRAITRTAGRAALLKGAFDTGQAIGDEVEKRTGIGKKFVEKSGLGDLAAKAGEKIVARQPRVKLSQEAQDRVDDEGVNNILRNFKDPDLSQQGSEYVSPDFVGYKCGGTVKPKKMASGGSTGSFRASANGIAQRGKTRGKYL